MLERVDSEGRLASRNLGSVVDTSETLLLYRYLDCSMTEASESMLLGLLKLYEDNGSYLISPGLEQGRFDATCHVYLALSWWRDFLEKSHSTLALEIQRSLDSMKAQLCLIDGKDQVFNNTRNLTRFWACYRGLVSWDTFPPVTKELFGFKLSRNLLKKILSPWMLLAMEVMALVMRNKKLSCSSHETIRSKLEWAILKSSHRFIPQYAERAFLYLSERIPSQQNSDGSFFGVSQMTAYGLMGLRELGYSSDSSEIRKGIQFLGTLQHEQNGYLVQDPFVGPIWETSHGLLSLNSEENSEIVSSMLAYLLNKQTPSGGWSYQDNNPNYPDCDDTALALTAIIRHKSKISVSTFECTLKKGLDWLLKMQNKDGSWAAWSKNQFAKNHGHYLIAERGFFKHAIVNDFGSADITGHVLVLLGMADYNTNSEAVKKALNYLRREQLPFGGFWARWGVNYLYGTSRVLLGLKSVKLKYQDGLVQNALRFLMNCQNPDGGFGEDSGSYFNIGLAGKGKSSVLQTAWVLRALLDWLPYDHASIKHGITFLLEKIEMPSEPEYLGVSMPPLLFAYDDLSSWVVLDVFERFEKLTSCGK